MNGASSQRGLQLLLLAAAATAAIYARTALSPLQETMRVAFPLSDNQIALLQGPALAVPMLLSAIPLGIIIDRYSRVRLLLILAILSVCGSVLTAFATDFLVLFTARCVLGLTAPGAAIAAASLLSDLFLPAQRGRANMVMAVAQVGGMSGAFALGGVLLAYFSAHPDGWRWAMLCATIPLVPTVFLVLAMREPPRTDRVIQKPSTREACIELWRYRAILVPLLIGGAMVGVADGAALIWAAPTLARNFSLPPERAGAVMAMVLLVSGIVGPIAGGTLADLCQRTGGSRRSIAVLSGLALLSAPAGLFALAPGVTSATIPLVLFMTMGSAISVTITTLCIVVIPNELRGLCMSFFFSASLLFGLGIAPLTVSLLSGALGGSQMIGNALALVCASTSLLGAALFIWGRRRVPQGARLAHAH